MRRWGRIIGILAAAILAVGVGGAAAGASEPATARYRPGLDAWTGYGWGAAPGTSESAPEAGGSGPAAEDSSAASDPVRRAVTVGAVAGGILGAGGAGFFIAIGHGLCDYEGCNDHPARDFLVGVPAGALIGALGGAAIGYFLGTLSSHPEGPKRRPSSAEEPAGGTGPGRTPADRSRRRGLLVLSGGLGDAAGRPDLGRGAAYGARLQAQFSPGFALGPELRTARLDLPVTALSAAATFSRPGGEFEPYLVGALGVGFWSDVPEEGTLGLVDAGVGLGVTRLPGAGVSGYGLEARYHWSPHHIENAERYRYFTLTFNGTFGW